MFLPDEWNQFSLSFMEKKYSPPDLNVKIKLKSGFISCVVFFFLKKTIQERLSLFDMSKCDFQSAEVFCSVFVLVLLPPPPFYHLFPHICPSNIMSVLGVCLCMCGSVCVCVCACNSSGKWLPVTLVVG